MHLEGQKKRQKPPPPPVPEDDGDPIREREKYFGIITQVVDKSGGERVTK
jgi:hypothetical protein